MKKTIFITLVLLFVSCTLSIAQPTLSPLVDCTASKTQLIFQPNQVRCLVGQVGYIFPNDDTSARFQVPYQRVNSPATIFSSGFWIGGKDAFGNLKVSAATYFNQTASNADYWAGPLDSAGLTRAADCSKWNKIWSVTRADILAHLADIRDGRIDQPNTAVLGWPAVGNPYFRQYNGFDLPTFNKVLAPFFDANQDGKYNPLMGDYPLPENVSNTLIPTQITWCLFNDYGNAHTTTSRAIPLQAEIHVTTWGFDCTNNRLFNRTVFTAHKVINRSRVNIDSVSMGILTDFDIGCYTDDAVGCNPLTNTFYGYNAALLEPDSCSFGIRTYPKSPPAEAVTFLNRPLSKFIAYTNLGACPASPAYLDIPSTGFGVYNALNGRWGNGTPLTFGGTGYNIGAATNFMFPDDPTNTTGWSQVAGNFGCALDRVSVGSTYVGTFRPNDTIRLDAAWSFHQDTSLNAWQNASLLRREIPSIQTWYNNRFQNACTLPTETADTEGVVFSVSPNPVQTVLTLNFGEETLKHVRLVNIMGQILLNEIKNDYKSAVLDVSLLPNGLYLIETDFEGKKGRVQKVVIEK